MVTATATRRTQAQRRAATRRRLVDATVQSLVAHGYAGTTTARICELADVSSGALFNHFPVKADLLVEAARTVLPDAMRRAAEEAGDLTRSADPIGDAIRLAMRMYRDHELAAVLELWVVARTDAELAPRLQELNAPHRASLYALIRGFVPERLRDHPDLITVADTVLDVAFAEAFALGRAPEESEREDRTELLAAMCRQHLLGA